MWWKAVVFLGSFYNLQKNVRSCESGEPRQLYQEEKMVYITVVIFGQFMSL